MMLDYALQYAGRSWRVFPVHAPAADGCSCGRSSCKDRGKHPRIKAWQNNATTDAEQITRWWTRWPDANIGIATGGGLVVLDIDGPQEMALLRAAVARYGPLPPAPAVRTGRGLHLYFRGDIGGSRKIGGLLFRGAGGFVIAPPSLHANGNRYQWVKAAPLPELPAWIEQWAQDWAQDTGNKQVSGLTSNTLKLGEKPSYLQQNNSANQTLAEKSSETIAARLDAALATPWTAEEYRRIREALRAIPADIERDPWLHVGMALHRLGWERPDGTDAGFELWNEWSATAKEKYRGVEDLEIRWRSFGKPRANKVAIGTLFHIAQQHGWIPAPPAARKEVMPDSQFKSPQSETKPHPLFMAGGAALQGAIENADITSAAGHDTLLGSSAGETASHINGTTLTLPAELSSTTNHESPLIRFNSNYAVIGDVGGKCLVLGWVPSKVDETIRVPSFQTFKSFAERYGNIYIQAKKPKGDKWVEEPTQAGAYWLRWAHRTNYEGIDLVPGAEHILAGNILNLWQGFAIEPRQGQWPLMRRHIARVLARGDLTSMEYILRWSAWKVQHPGERAEVALVFKGAKGSGKGTYANALRRVFGQHGLQIWNSKHLVGAFNGHLRNCLLLYADEAFWAGDKHGESVLKGMLTEPSLMIEQKGVDAAPWKNRLGVIMSANADWVVPASHDERRYAVFEVDDRYAPTNGKEQSDSYFKALYREMAGGGLDAMLWDLQNMELGDWHPRRLPETEALQFQKLRSLAPLLEWYEGLLSDGMLHGAKKDSSAVAAGVLLNMAREAAPRLRDVSAAALGRMLADMGLEKIHTPHGSAWKFGPLQERRQAWERRFGSWKWSNPIEEWAVR